MIQRQSPLSDQQYMRAELDRQMMRNPAITARELAAIYTENAHQIAAFIDYMPNVRAARTAISDRFTEVRRLTASARQECAKLDHGTFVCPHHDSQYPPKG